MQVVDCAAGSSSGDDPSMSEPADRTLTTLHAALTSRCRGNTRTLSRTGRRKKRKQLSRASALTSARITRRTRRMFVLQKTAFSGRLPRHNRSRRTQVMRHLIAAS